MEKTPQTIRPEKSETNFTKEELFLIEKTLDKLAEDCAKGLAQAIHMMSKYAEKDEAASKLLKKLSAEHFTTFDTARTISAKCAIISGRGKQ